jgi:single-strand DNA-binding protein
MSSRSLNKVQLIGNLTRDPELRYTPNGTAVCSFGLATNRSWASGDEGERKEETEFHRIVAWNKLAELCSQLLTKGRKVYIEGRLQTRSWEGPEGEKRQATEIVAEDMMLLDSRRDAATDTSHREEADRPSKVEEEDQSASANEAEDKGKKKGKEKKEENPSSKEEAKEEKSDEIDIDDIPF